MKFNDFLSLKIFQKPKLLAVVFVLLLSFSAFAKNVSEYRKGVEEAMADVAELIGHLYDVEEEISDPDAVYERAQIAKIRASLPGSERIEWQGTVVETSNQWLNEKLDNFSTEKFDSANRKAILMEISERLDSLLLKLKELEAPTVAGRAKDEEKQKLSEILKREEYQKPEEKQKSLFEKWYDAFIKWLEEIFPRPQMPTSSPNSSGVGSLSLILQILLYAVVIGIAAFIIYRFAPFFINKFKKREKREKKDRVILGEKIAASEDSSTIFDEAENLARQGNLRDAIRKGYIALLCELSDRKVIGLAHYKTNRDYLRDVRKKEEIYENMNGLTVSFEKHWYGFESPDEEDWSEFRQKYQKTVSAKQ